MKIVLGIIFALFSATCLAGTTANNEYILNTQMGPAAHKVQMGTIIRQTSTVAIGKYSFAVQGGKSVGTGVFSVPLLTDLTNKKSFLTIPAGAIITNAWFNTLSPIKSLAINGNPKFGASVLGGADLLASTDASTSFFTITKGVPQLATTTTWISLPLTSAGYSNGATTVKVNITGSDITSGVFNAYIEYVLGN